MGCVIPYGEILVDFKSFHNSEVVWCSGCNYRPSDSNFFATYSSVAHVALVLLRVFINTIVDFALVIAIIFIFGKRRVWNEIKII